ncbi:hypothetical protein KM043_006323 [Ampulex compressa]|nr:hypothetical protein KM043_006323 [Ampulex compressa]
MIENLEVDASSEKEAGCTCFGDEEARLSAAAEAAISETRKFHEANNRKEEVWGPPSAAGKRETRPISVRQAAGRGRQTMPGHYRLPGATTTWPLHSNSGRRKWGGCRCERVETPEGWLLEIKNVDAEGLGAVYRATISLRLASPGPPGKKLALLQPHLLTPGALPSPAPWGLLDEKKKKENGASEIARFRARDGCSKIYATFVPFAGEINPALRDAELTGWMKAEL